MKKYHLLQSTSKIWLTVSILTVAAVALVFHKRSACPDSTLSDTKAGYQTPLGYKSRRATRSASGDVLPLQLQKFRDGIIARKYDPEKFSKLLSSIPSISVQQANAIINQVGEDRLATYLGSLPVELRDDYKNNQMLYYLLVDRLIANNPSEGIDTIKKMGPPVLYSSQYSNLLTKAALDPSNALASKISNELIPCNSWPLRIDGRLFENLLNSGLEINEVIERLESLPGGKGLAASAVSQRYQIDDAVVNLNSPGGKYLLEYIEHANNITLNSKALIDKLTSNEKNFSSDE